LISNAIKHNSSANKKLVISSQRKGEFYEFIVADNGPGIAPEYHEKIFQMFQTLEAGDKFKNTGVGLPIVKKLVEETNGSIKVEPVAGGGTAFVFLWPTTFENAK
jgi:signal transduction histidine kinase